MLEKHNSEQLSANSVVVGMQAAALAIGKQLGEQEALRKTTRIEKKIYEDGSRSEVEIWGVTGQVVDLNSYKHSGLDPRRKAGDIEPKRKLTEAPDRNGRSAIFFDNGGSIFIQDGVSYIFNAEGHIKSVALDEVSTITIGARDSFWLTEAQDNHTVNPVPILVKGKPIAVGIETIVSL